MLFIIFVCCLFVCFCFDFFVLFFFLYCISWLILIFFFLIFILYFNRNRQNNIAMKIQDTSCPTLAVSVLSSSVEPPSQSLAVFSILVTGSEGLLGRRSARYSSVGSNGAWDRSSRPAHLFVKSWS